jgi:hypothetical protein
MREGVNYPEPVTLLIAVIPLNNGPEILKQEFSKRISATPCSFADRYGSFG